MQKSVHNNDRRRFYGKEKKGVKPSIILTFIWKENDKIKSM